MVNYSSGVLDTTFGTGGLVTTSFNSFPGGDTAAANSATLAGPRPVLLLLCGGGGGQCRAAEQPAREQHQDEREEGPERDPRQPPRERGRGHRPRGHADASA